MAKKKKNRILLSGGGTGGSVSPLLAVAEECPKYDFLWVGTKSGPEKEMVIKTGIKFKSIISGKLRRYFSFRNFIDPLFIFVGFIQSFFIILFSRPKLIMSAGSFVSVPIVWAGWLLGVPVLIHQQDKRPGLANKLMAPFANTVTVTFKESLNDYGKKAVWTGNPTRQSQEISNGKTQIVNNDLPLVLIVGGGTGAKAINELVEESFSELTKFCQVIHVTGKGNITSHKSFEFLEYDEMMSIMRKADIVISRAGLGFLTEISYLKKPAIIIPMPGTHQEDNADVFAEKQAAIVLDQSKLTKEDFINNIKGLLNNNELRNKLRNNIGEVMKPGANKSIAEIIENTI